MHFSSFRIFSAKSKFNYSWQILVNTPIPIPHPFPGTHSIMFHIDIHRYKHDTNILSVCLHLLSLHRWHHDVELTVSLTFYTQLCGLSLAMCLCVGRIHCLSAAGISSLIHSSTEHTLKARAYHLFLFQNLQHSSPWRSPCPGFQANHLGKTNIYLIPQNIFESLCYSSTICIFH